MQENKFNELEKNLFIRFYFEWIEALIPALITAILILTFVCRLVTVKGESMEKTLLEDDKLVIRNFFYKPKNGDIVVIGPTWNLPEHIIVKRIIATPGQTFSINFDSGDITVDGAIINEPYIKERTKLEEGGEIPSVIPEGHVFVMGDNRNNSTDSRSYRLGLVPIEDIVGKAEYIVFPFNRFRRL